MGDLQDKIKHNIWDTNLDEVVSTVKELTTDTDTNEWSWVFNSNCKYISIRIDMRDGAFCLCDRNGNRIDLETLRKQNK